MVHQNVAKCLPNVYNVRELVLVKSLAKDKGVCSQRLSLIKPKCTKVYYCEKKPVHKYKVALISEVGWGESVRLG